MLSIRELIAGTPNRLRYVIRFSTSRIQHRESVAEHSFYVALYALHIGTWVNEEIKEGRIDTKEWGAAEDICIGALLQRALLHDLEEARSGDFPRPFKYSSSSLKGMLDQASELAAKQIVYPIWGQSWKPDDIDEDVSPADTFYQSWADAKDGTPEGRILEFCDFLAVLGYLLEEGAGSGNRTILRHVKDMGEYFSRFGQPEYLFLRPLISQATGLMAELTNDYQS